MADGEKSAAITVDGDRRSASQATASAERRVNKNKIASVKSTETTKAKAKEVVAKHEARKALKADRVEVRHGEVR